MEKEPNIILFIADQQAAIHRKKERSEADNMPFLDEFAGQGAELIFCRAYTPNPTYVPRYLVL